MVKFCQSSLVAFVGLAALLCCLCCYCSGAPLQALAAANETEAPRNASAATKPANETKPDPILDLLEQIYQIRDLMLGSVRSGLEREQQGEQRGDGSEPIAPAPAATPEPPTTTTQAPTTTAAAATEAPATTPSPTGRPRPSLLPIQMIERGKSIFTPENLEGPNDVIKMITFGFLDDNSEESKKIARSHCDTNLETNKASTSVLCTDVMEKLVDEALQQKRAADAQAAREARERERLERIKEEAERKKKEKEECEAFERLQRKFLRLNGY